MIAYGKELPLSTWGGVQEERLDYFQSAPTVACIEHTQLVSISNEDGKTVIF